MADAVPAFDWGWWCVFPRGWTRGRIWWPECCWGSATHTSLNLDVYTWKKLFICNCVEISNNPTSPWTTNHRQNRRQSCRWIFARSQEKCSCVSINKFVIYQAVVNKCVVTAVANMVVMSLCCLGFILPAYFCTWLDDRRCRKGQCESPQPRQLVQGRGRKWSQAST